MRKTPIKRGKKQLKRTPFKAKTVLRRKNTGKGAKRSKLPPLKKLRDKADSLLTPICKKRSPQCECCDKPTEVGHHWIEKSRSAYLRYDLRNIVALCHSCHAKIHNRFGNSVMGGFDVAEIIIRKRGREWKEQLDLDQPKYVKVDRAFYEKNIDRLSNQ